MYTQKCQIFFLTKIKNDQNNEMLRGNQEIPNCEG